jgi:hypothetical protein
MEHTVPVRFSDAGMDIGRDNGMPVDRSYADKSPFAFTGTVKKVVFDVNPHLTLDCKRPVLDAGDGFRRTAGRARRATCNDLSNASRRCPLLINGLQLLPGPVVHPDLAATSPLAAAHEHGAAPLIEVRLSQRERSWMRSPAPQSTTMSARSRAP